ncbi:MAG: hypothetical protein KKB51_17385 [Candidatus Riflebacteria bacterium]|nr:hypothetical protein [Candidatus Riflebacteria bacterium]
MITESEIIEDLGSNTTALRISAIESAIRFGRSARLLDVLKAHEKSEPDPSCQELLFLAVKKLTALRDDSKTEDTSDWLEIFCSQEFPGLSPDRKLEIVAMLSEKQRQVAADKAFTMIFANEPETIVAQIITFFSPYWGKDRLGKLVPLLKSKDLSVRCACVEALCDHASELILPRLPNLLLHNDSRIQLLAVKFLTRLDQFEAISYLELILLGPDLEKKVRALRLCIFIPFDQVKNLLVEFIAKESNEELIKRAGLILINNPDCEVPFRLTEIADAATAEKSVLVKKLIKAACQNLRDSGVLGDNFNSYLEKLKNWLKCRELKKWVQQWIFLFENSPEEKQPELLLQLKDFASGKDSQESLREAMGWSLKESTSKVILKALETEPESPKNNDQQSLEYFSTLDESAKIRFVQLWPQSDSHEFVEFSRAFWLHSWYTPDVGAAFLKMALSLNLDNYIEFARTSLNLANENIQVSSIAYLLKFDSDYLATQLGKFLSRSSLKIKMSALGALQKIDKEQALSTLKAMLFQKDLTAQKAALACMIYFDFAVVRPVLSEFLEANRNSEIWHSALILLQANVEIENLYCLFKLRNKASAENLSLVLAAEKELCERLLQEKLIAAGNVEALYNQFKLRAEKENISDKNPPAYALKRVKSGSESIGAENNGRKFLIVSGLVIFLVVLGIGFSGNPEVEYGSTIVAKAYSSPVLERKIFRATLVSPGYKDGYLHVTSNNVPIKICAPYGKFDWLKPGDDVELTVAITKPDLSTSSHTLLSLSRIGRPLR